MIRQRAKDSRLVTAAVATSQKKSRNARTRLVRVVFLFRAGGGTSSSCGAKPSHRVQDVQTVTGVRSASVHTSETFKHICARTSAHTHTAQHRIRKHTHSFRCVCVCVVHNLWFAKRRNGMRPFDMHRSARACALAFALITRRLPAALVCHTHTHKHTHVLTAQVSDRERDR